jgi:hypothetical protein
VNVVGHDDIAQDVEVVTGAGVLEDRGKVIARLGSSEDGTVPDTTEGDEVEVA